MAPLYISCIVEGQGDVNAVPVLLKRLVKLVNPNVYADVHPFRASRSKLVLLGELERAVERAGRGLRAPGVVLIIVDSDDDCPKELAPMLLSRAMDTANRRWPVGVVLAKSEFESWFIAAAESIAGHSALPPHLAAPADPESIRDAKGWLQKEPCLKVESIPRPWTNLRWQAGSISLPRDGRLPSTKCIVRSNVSVHSRLRFKVKESVTLTDQRLQTIFREAFENDKLTLTDSLSPETMPQWDSLAHVKIMMGCEEEFGVKFTIDETVESTSAAKLKAVLAAKGVGR